MYRFSRAIFVEIKDLVDPHPETITAPEAKRHVLHCCEAHDRAAGPRPALLREAQPEPLLRRSGTCSRSPTRRASTARSTATSPRRSSTSWRSSSGPARARRSVQATTRKGKPCQRTPLPDREYCPSHQHLEERSPAVSRRSRRDRRPPAARAACGGRALTRPPRPAGSRPAAGRARGRAARRPGRRSPRRRRCRPSSALRAGGDREVRVAQLGGHRARGQPLPDERCRPAPSAIAPQLGVQLLAVADVARRTSPRSRSTPPRPARRHRPRVDAARARPQLLAHAAGQQRRQPAVVERRQRADRRHPGAGQPAPRPWAPRRAARAPAAAPGTAASPPGGDDGDPARLAHVRGRPWPPPCRSRRPASRTAASARAPPAGSAPPARRGSPSGSTR